jgi:hypothetical protein
MEKWVIELECLNDGNEQKHISRHENNMQLKTKGKYHQLQPSTSTTMFFLEPWNK